MARSVEFRRLHKPFQAQLAEDVRNINASSAIYVSADKTSNMYKVEVENYDKILQDNISNNYRKPTKKT